jgi:hypothetical protein
LEAESIPAKLSMIRNRSEKNLKNLKDFNFFSHVSIAMPL